MTKILLISINTISYSQQSSILIKLFGFGFINVAIATNNNGDLEVTKYSYKKIIKRLRNVVDSEVIFPDKLKDLNGYKYRVVIYSQVPRVIIKNNMLISPLVNFIFTVAEHQNASLNFILLNNFKNFGRLYDDRLMDLTLNTAIIYLNSPYPKLLTYEETAYCALIPKEAKTTKVGIIFLEPFGGVIWTLFALSIICCVVIWKVFHGQEAVDSYWLVGAGIAATFINQNLNFSNRNHAVLNILFHLIILMIFVLSNAYEGAITSTMIQPVKEHRLKNFDQLLASNFELMTDKPFAHFVKDSEDFMAIKSRINTSFIQLKGSFYKEVKRQHFVFVSTCETIEYDDQFENDKKFSDYYYLLSERILKSYVNLEASFLNPFIDRLQYFMDLSFQAGLPQIWRTLATEKQFIPSFGEFVASSQFLKLSDLSQVFCILFIGLGVSASVLVVEIFFYDFLRNLNFKNSFSKLLDLTCKKKKVRNSANLDSVRSYWQRLNHNKLRVRKILVQPRRS